MTLPPPRRRLWTADRRAADPTTPIYNVLATEWAAAGRAIPGAGTLPHLLITDGSTPVPTPPAPTGSQ